MAVTKTNFINYSRCSRYVSLSEIKKERMDADISYEEYEKEELNNKISEMVSSMYDTENEEEIDLIDRIDPQLEAMMDYYREVEVQASKVCDRTFGGTTKSAKNTYEQECFDFTKNGIKYLCYVDVYNENENGINIIEVKATTSNKYMSLGNRNASIFLEKNNIKYLKDELSYDIEAEMDLKVYGNNRNKLFNKYDIGKYVYDLAIQRFIIENEYKSSHNEEKIANIHYYLAVLNHEYIYDGYQENGKNYYRPDEEGHELITFFDLTNITKEYQSIIETDSEKIERYLKELDASPCKLGIYCERKKRGQCKFFDNICGKMIPKKNSSFNYVHNPAGFVTDSGERLKGLDLINEGYINMLDIPDSWIKSETHKIQRECLSFNKEYINKEKISDMLNQINYPIYHLDFETFPCPIPRFIGETPYMQSPFEFSLHIEHSPNQCDFDNDNYVFLADSTKDIREEMIKKMLEYMDPNKGTLLAQNVSFEKGRIKELARMFPKYQNDLMKLYDRGFDLLWVINTNSKIYESLGYNKEESKIMNYYHPNLSGSYSIKKTLPVFSNLKYDDLEVKNGTEAIIAYANYDKMSKGEFRMKYKALVDYCKQDTWAMVEILKGLRKLVK